MVRGICSGQGFNQRLVDIAIVDKLMNEYLSMKLERTIFEKSHVYFLAFFPGVFLKPTTDK